MSATDSGKLTERTLTTCLLCQLAALFLMSALSGKTVGRLLHAATGQWHLDSWAGHCFFIGAAGMLVVNIGSRLDITHQQLRAAFRRRFELPMTVIVPILLGLLTMSSGADQNSPDMFMCKTDHWLDFYWTLLCGFLIFLLATAMGLLAVIRQDPRNRRTATAYMIALTAGCASCTLRIVATWENIDTGIDAYFWSADCLASLIFSWAAAQSWRKKVRDLSPKS